MTSRGQQLTQVTSAAKAGICERSGRDIETGKRIDPKQKPRHWRTRSDPFESVWETELAPLLANEPSLQAITLLEHLQSCHPGQFPDKLLRTLQRRVKRWYALHGPAKEVIFRQTHVIGRQGLSDFTTLKRVTITIGGEPFKHLLYHFRLAFSHWSYMNVIEGGESFTALAKGLQEALQRLGGAPLEHRTDSLSAAFKNINQDAQTDITQRYEALCQQYNMVATRNNRGVGHENGSVESAHGHLKRRIEQGLLLRGSADFSCVEDYQAFIDGVVQQHNQRNAKAVVEERVALQALPAHRAADYTEVSVVVSHSSTIDVRRVTYTVPSRLQTETLHVRLYDNRLACYLGHVLVIELKRLYPKGSQRARQVDYRHVIDSLAKKPSAFGHSVLRNELLPNLDYHTIWRLLESTLSNHVACKLMVGLLYLAAQEDCQDALAQHVLELLHSGQEVVLSRIQQRFKKGPAPVPDIVVTQHKLTHYDQWIPTIQQAVNHA
jgi:hypothetical protein